MTSQNTQSLDAGREADYEKQPVKVQAIQWNGDNLDAVIRFCSGNAAYELMARGDGEIVIATLEDGADKVARHVASKGDYIIRGIQGEYYPCKPDIFEGSYQRPLAATSAKPADEVIRSNALKEAADLCMHLENNLSDGAEGFGADGADCYAAIMALRAGWVASQILPAAIANGEGRQS